ncbi:M35 family metallo-endopeptidase [Granulosicoccus antarcticus]|uniref:Lysine-specific metallo-endopeptidase domain-containing protein n=1 Tax=Granulosicoccus antarcticus IMCC3135 TaxID=1192854 RepID=A0A2Z2NV98_9GAMM|nr:M35 family metallo-endopeptidase [Granulosicoccus antarcticus]ASJ74435.1 hypothetical protein IMCC3135_21795 [Granulosicoccus antarcticus IMCC3135]
MRFRITRFAAVLLCCLSSMAVHAGPLRLVLEPGSAAGSVAVSLTNTGSSTLSVLRWDTPFEDALSSDVFRVERYSKDWPLVEQAAYIGRSVKRGVPTTDEYLVLAPGETASRTVKLNDYYRIDKADGRSVSFAGQLRYSVESSSSKSTSVRKAPEPELLSVDTLKSNSVAVNMAPAVSLRALTPAYESCSVQEQADIFAATELAQEYVNTAIADLESLASDERSGSPRYVTWFGEYEEARFTRVLSNFQSIGTALADEQIQYDCSCDERNTYAYVFPSRPYEIYLCPSFRSASLSGTDSRAGTIVHELSHFTVLADTDDNVYSQRGAQSLATTDPEKAIANADSHEYFAENTPELEILGTTNPTQPLQHTTLTLDTSLSGTVGSDDFITYQVSGAQKITLTSISGDADLYVYTDEALSAESCNSINANAVDICENFVEGTVYIRVFGFTSASFTLEASSPEPVAPAAVTLELDSALAGALEENARDVYLVNGAQLVELESLSGDADLYIFDSIDFVDANLVCASASIIADSTTDSCDLPLPDNTYYVLVVGSTASDYSLLATSQTADPIAPLPDDDDPAPVVPVTPSVPDAPTTTPAIPDDDLVPSVTPIASSSSSGIGSLNFWGLGVLLLSLAYQRSVTRRGRG